MKTHSFDKVEFIQVITTSPKTKGNKRSSSPTKINLLKAEALYKRNGIFYVKVKDEHNRANYVDINKDNLIKIANITDCLYTLPENNEHVAWTRKDRVPHEVTRPEISLQYWSALKNGLVVYGEVRGTEFHILQFKDIKLDEQDNTTDEDK